MFPCMSASLHLRVVCCCVGWMDIVRCRKANGNGGRRVQSEYVDPGRKEETFGRRVRGVLVHDVIGILSRSFGIFESQDGYLGGWVVLLRTASKCARAFR